MHAGIAVNVEYAASAFLPLNGHMQEQELDAFEVNFKILNNEPQRSTNKVISLLHFKPAEKPQHGW